MTSDLHTPDDFLDIEDFDFDESKDAAFAPAAEVYMRPIRAVGPRSIEPSQPRSVQPTRPRNFRLRVPSQTPDAQDQQVWWSYGLYRDTDGRPVETLYSKDIENSETITRQFLHEKVLGFDMEWTVPWLMVDKDNPRLQERIGLIQLACEDKISLIHLGRHTGNTPEALIAPSLKKIIESPDITKAGVGVLNADMSRLAKWFGLKPKGAMELSHLHNLVTHGYRNPASVNTQLVKLEYLVKTHLGYPLSKDGSTRMSNWSKVLNVKQREYAAADAYAGFMLYHCMNSKRLAMEPVPSLPLHADKYLPMKQGCSKIIELRFEPTREGIEYSTLDSFCAVVSNQAHIDFRSKQTKEQTKEQTKVQSATGIDTESATKEQSLPVQGDAKQKKVKEEKSRTRSREARKAERQQPLNTDSRRLYSLLCARRKALGAEEKCALYLIAHNTVLEDLARNRPTTEEGMIGIRGLGKRGIQKYGAHWLEVIQSFTATCNHLKEPTNAVADPVSTDTDTIASDLVAHIAGKTVQVEPEDPIPDSSSAFGSPLRRPPTLHTGMSFSMAQSSLHDREDSPMEEEPGFYTPESGNSPSLKRKSSIEFLAPRKVSPRTEQPVQLSASDRIFRNKVEAYSKRISWLLQPRPVDPLLSSSTLNYLARHRPTTEEDLQYVPGLETLSAACATLNKNLFGTITKFAKNGP